MLKNSRKFNLFDRWRGAFGRWARLAQWLNTVAQALNRAHSISPLCSLEIGPDGGLEHDFDERAMLRFVRAADLEPLRVAAADSSAPDKAAADYVCDGTDDQEEINAALAAISSGGMVYLYNGNYSTSDIIKIVSSCTIEGASTAGTIISPSKAVSVAINSSTVHVEAISFLKFTITKNGANSFSTGMQIFGCKSFSVGQCTVTYCSTFGIYCGTGHGSPSVSIKQCTVSYNGDNIYVYSDGMCTIANTTASNSTTGGGITIGSTQRTPVLLSKCTASSNTSHGIISAAGSEFHGSAFACVASSNGTFGMHVAIAHECTASSNTSYGIATDAAYGCTAASNGTQDLQAKYAVGCTATNRLVADDADLPAYSGSFSVVTGVDFVNSTVTTATITVAANGRITNVV
jgi:parallel beta-helix repeat protein